MDTDKRMVPTSILLNRAFTNMRLGSPRLVDQGPRVFNVSELLPESDLTEFTGRKTCPVKIVKAFTFNKIFITPPPNTVTMKLMDELSDCMDFDGLSERPPVGSIVGFKFSDDNFYRGEVKKVSPDGTVQLQLIDLGHFFKVRYSELKPLPVTVMRFPPMGWTVKVHGIKDDPPLLLEEAFTRQMEQAKKLKWILSACEYIENEYIVELESKTEQRGKFTLAGMIKCKEIWEWEKILKTLTTTSDDILINTGKWGNATAKIDHVKPLILPIGVRIEGKITRALDSGIIYIGNIQEPTISRDMKVLSHQINRYVEMVPASPFFPPLDSFFLLYLEDLPEIQDFNLNGTGRWNRCMRQTLKYYKNLDFDESYPVECEYEESYKIRRICPEFLKIPIGIIECEFHGRMGTDITPTDMQMLQELITIDPKVNFIVKRYDETTLKHIISCPQLLARAGIRRQN